MVELLIQIARQTITAGLWSLIFRYNQKKLTHQERKARVEQKKAEFLKQHQQEGDDDDDDDEDDEE